MTSLIGLLLAASPARRQALARRWALDDTTDDESIVASLFRRISDEWYLRPYLEQLNADERLSLTTLVRASGGSGTFEELRFKTRLSEARLRQALAVLEEGSLVTHDAQARPTFAIIDDLRATLRRQLGGNRESERVSSVHGHLNGLPSSALHTLADRWRIPRARQLARADVVRRLEWLIGSKPEVDNLVSSLPVAARTLFLLMRTRGGRFGTQEAAQLIMPTDDLRRAYQELKVLGLADEGYGEGQPVLRIVTGAGVREMPAPEARHAPPLERWAVSDEPARALIAGGELLSDIEGLLGGRSHRAKGEQTLSGGLRCNCIWRERGEIAERKARARQFARELGLLRSEQGRIVIGDVASWRGLDRLDQARVILELWLSIPRGQGTRLAQRIERCLCDALLHNWYSLRSLLYRLRWLGTGLDTPVSRRGPRSSDGGVRYELLTLQWMGAIDLATEGRDIAAFRVTPLGAKLFHSRRSTSELDQ